MRQNRRPALLCLIVTLVCMVTFAVRPAWALEPDEILLITNKNTPDSQKLARIYCQLRQVPADQIVSLDLPTTEEMPFETYETNVVAPVRQFILDHNLKTRIKCLLTFYGVPFRIHNKENTPAEDRELTELRDVQKLTGDELQKAVEHIESVAAGADPAFKPGSEESIDALLKRDQAALKAIATSASSITDDTQRASLQKEYLAGLDTIGGPAEIDRQVGASQRADPTKSDAEKEPWDKLHQEVLASREAIQKLQSTRWDATARSQLRLISRARFGLIGLLRVLDAEIVYLTPAQTGSATDNELALLWTDYYPRGRWLPNPLNVAFAGRPTNAVMVMRLDGPDPSVVERLMRTSVKVEQTGLEGTIAIDARGLTPIDDKGNLNPMGEFDQTLRDLAQILRTKTKLNVVLDNQDIVFPPHYVKNVACYCGWYSVQNYIPGCDFNPGAVGYHIASYEMIILHEPANEWVRGLLNDGVVATLGAVAEPYLAAFPKPDEFFPLLLTGKLPLAEVYWKTNPMTSWMISFIGDPLYTPYKLHPALLPEDLPPGLRKALQ